MLIKTTMKIYEKYIKEILDRYDDYIFGDIYHWQKSKDYIIIEVSYSQTTDEIEMFSSRLEDTLEIDDEGEAGDIGGQLFEAKGDLTLGIKEAKTSLKNIQNKVDIPTDFLFIDDNFEL